MTVVGATIAEEIQIQSPEEIEAQPIQDVGPI